MLKFAVVILTIMLAYATVYSLIGLIAPKVVMKTSLEASVGKTLSDAENDGYLKALTVAQRSIGVFALATIISGFFVLFAGFLKAQKWAWWGFLIVGGVAWIGGVIISIAIGDKLNMTFQLIGAALCIIGVVLPIQEFFTGSAKEA